MTRATYAGAAFFLWCAAMSLAGSRANAIAEWTVMVFQNGDNNLEADAIQDFREMAKVGSSPTLNVVVQLDRRSKENHLTTPDWDQTLRFLVKKNMEPIPANAVADIGEANMGDGATLADFVSWAASAYPAHRRALVIWDHGQGWRLFTVQPLVRSVVPSQQTPAPSAKPNPPPNAIPGSPFRAISYDETSNNDKLYNREIEDALKQANVHLDFLGFDACLMAMVETAYAFRDVAPVLVASEELAPGTGWDYSDWLKRLAAKPTMDARQLASATVASYADQYTRKQMDEQTLSAIDLTQIADLAMSVSNLGTALQTQLKSNPLPVQTARSSCRTFAPNPFGDGKDYFQHIDLGRFASQLTNSPSLPATTAAAKKVLDGVQRTVFANYAGSARGDGFGATGLAIYFPATGALYGSDPYAENGYEKDNTLYPVEFVGDASWPEFLHDYFRVYP